VPKTDESRPDNHVQADSEEENPSNTTLSQCQNVTTEQPAIVPRHQGKGKDHNRSHCLKLRLSTMEENICISVWKRLWPANLLVMFFQNANLLQYARLYIKSPDMIPSSIRKKVRYISP
jgi:hypothetical protein